MSSATDSADEWCSSAVTNSSQADAPTSASSSSGNDFKCIVIRQPSPRQGAPEFTISVLETVYEIAITLKASFLDACIDVTCSEIELNEQDQAADQLHFLTCFLKFLFLYLEEDASHPNSILEVLRAAVQCADDTILLGNDIHTVVAELPISDRNKGDTIRAFVKARDMLQQPHGSQLPPLLSFGLGGPSTLYSVFGGQGNCHDYFSEMREIYYIYGPILERIVESASKLLQSLASRTTVIHCFPKGMDLMRWLENDSQAQPSNSYLLSAPVSFPLITLLQLMHFKISCEFLGCTLRDMQRMLAGVTGHSQGILAAVAVAAADDTTTFDEVVLQALTISFAIGTRIHESYGSLKLPQAIVESCLTRDVEIPTPMLSVRGMSMNKLLATIDKMSTKLPKTQVKMELCLKNGTSSFVVTGDPMSLHALRVHLGDTFVSVSSPTKKPLRVFSQFLPTTAPYHNSCLSAAASKAIEDCQGLEIRGCELKLTVFSPVNGTDLRDLGDANIVPHLIRMVSCEGVDWPAALSMPNATHILDFGPGGIQGVGMLAHGFKMGRGVRVILATVLNGSNSELGYMADLYDRSPYRQGRLLDLQAWDDAFQPRLARFEETRQIVVDTRFTKLFRLPPLMVAAMTPTTSSWKFVAATMNAGYHAELACGGFNDALSLSKAVKHLTNSIEPGRGITCNVIYSNPTALRWQIAELQRLVACGYHIEGLTIGAGVPSTEIIREYVHSLHLQHISLKPGTIEAIQQTLEIAKSLKPFPVILQWTGGRGGGHHSNEDFHSPLIHTYTKVRSMSNVILVVGSGFGSSEETLPYLTGRWAIDLGLPSMPVDGVLLASRVMVAKEARTSLQAKEVIVQTTGVKHNEWDDLSLRSTGGVLSVISEMGQPIHKIATRAVKLWHELDATVFCLPVEKRVLELAKRREEIILRLNADYHRVWFGCSGHAQDPADLDDMTYSEVLSRFVQLTYVRHEKRWGHESWRTLFFYLLRRVQARFCRTDKLSSCFVPKTLEGLDEPYSTLESVREAMPEATTQLISYDDMMYFLHICRPRGRKPVPFIPILDENFETWFKKDSLWQSEDLAAVPHQDVERVCILHGPVAAQYSTRIDEPIGEILGQIHSAWAAKIMANQYDGRVDQVPVFDNSPPDATQFLISPPSDSVCSLDDWISCMKNCSDTTLRWVKALVTTPRIRKDRKVVPNPFTAILSALRNDNVYVSSNLKTSSKPSFTFLIPRPDQTFLNVVVLSLSSDGQIVIEINHHQSIVDKPTVLKYCLFHKPNLSFVEIIDGDNDRPAIIRDFYYRLWFGAGQEPSGISIYDEFKCGPYTLTADAIRQYHRSTGASSGQAGSLHGALQAPLDFAVVIAWESLTKPLFSRHLAANMLKLLHLSNQTRIIPGQSLPVAGDTLYTTSIVTEVALLPIGRMVEVQASIFNNTTCILQVKTQFILRENDADQLGGFRRMIIHPSEMTLKTHADVVRLREQSWFHPIATDSDMIGKTCVFELEQFCYSDAKQEVKGHAKSDGKVVGKCHLVSSDDSGLELIQSFLKQRTASPSRHAPLETPVDLFQGQEITFDGPDRNQSIAYAAISGDFNPIHVAPVFAGLADLPNTIAHGMHVSAKLQQVAYKWLCDGTRNRLRNANVSFMGKVFSKDHLRISFRHVAMHQGRRVVEAEVRNTETTDIVLKGTYEVEELPTALVFTGQGSQKKGMGMELYKTSAAARQIWDDADEHFQRDYGKMISHNSRLE